MKAKNILNIEAGLEMIALAMAISSEVGDGDLIYENVTNKLFIE